MENFFRKYNWAVYLGLIGFGSLLLALIANNFLASQLAPYTVPELPSLGKSGGPVIDEGLAKADWSSEIAGRCLFGCIAPVVELGCPDGCAEGEDCQNGICVGAPMVSEPMIVSDVPVQSDLNVKLLGCMVARQPQWSMALLMDNRTQQTHVTRVGDIIPEDAEILEIHRDRVILRRNSRLEFIRMENTLGGNPSPNARVPITGADPQAAAQRVQRSQQPSIAAQNGAGVGAGAGNAVQQVSENKYTVNRAAIDQELSNPEALARQARIMPNYKDGEKAGLRLVGISPNSVYSQLGIRSGDVIHSVNGVPLDNQRKAMEMLEQMRREKNVTIEVERRGKKEKIEYDIR
ncbi:MAG: PDZ domain-containing protein [Bradymonadaceae bacterium]|nr:PDZ domain-containing protein [Lujinxingiaceae bacterium]